MTTTNFDKDRLRTVIVNDTSVNNHHGCSVVMKQIRQKCDENGIDVIATVPLRVDWRGDEYKPAIESADIVIVNAEGSVHGSRPFARELIEVSSHCKAHGIPVVFINGVYQNNDDAMGSLMRDFDQIYVRESRSHSELSKIGIESTIVPDMVFSLSVDNATQTKDIPVLFTDSVNRSISKTLIKRSKAIDGSIFITLRMRPKHKTWPLIGWAQKKLLSNSFNKIGSFNIYGWGRNSYCKDLNDLLALISAAKIVVTGRFHMLCFCLLQKAPFIAIPSNSHKIEGLLEDIGLYHRIAPNIDSMELSLYNRLTKEEVNLIENYLSSAKSKIDAMFANISQLAKRSPEKR